jgi:hypothetical protein
VHDTDTDTDTDTHTHTHTGSGRTGTGSGSARQLHCPQCEQDCLFERPPCGDGHGEDCPEWACVCCGWAVMAEFDVAAVRVGASAGTTVAGSARSAA